MSSRTAVPDNQFQQFATLNLSESLKVVKFTGVVS